MNLPTFPPLRSASDKMLHLDLLRFVASCGIVLHHSKEYFLPMSERATGLASSTGLALFVDLFFVISGYVIAYVYSERMQSPADFSTFIQNRVGRLVPLHWLTLGCAIVLWAVLARLGAHGNHEPSFKPECIAVTAALLHAGISCGGYYFNGPSWSISAEMGMYLAFPALLLVGRLHRALPLTLGFTFVAAFLAAIWLGHAPPSTAQWEQVEPYVRATPSFLVGIGLWFLRDEVARIPWPRPILGLSTIALLATMVMGAPATLTLALVYLVAISGVAADLQRRTSRIVTATAPLGELTYSIYMWHSLFILVFMNIVGDKFLKARGGEMAILAIVTYAAILGWSYISLFCFEKPAREWVKRHPLSGAPNPLPPPLNS